MQTLTSFPLDENAFSVRRLVVAFMLISSFNFYLGNIEGDTTVQLFALDFDFEVADCSLTILTA